MKWAASVLEICAKISGAARPAAKQRTVSEFGTGDAGSASAWPPYILYMQIGGVEVYE